jgi:hypothetical protein
MVTGINPFQGQSFVSTVGKIMSPEIPSFAVAGASSSGFQEIIRRTLQKKRDHRYPSAKMLADDLARLRGLGAPSASSAAINRADLTVIPRKTSLVLMTVMQVMYLCIYAFALYYLGDVIRGLRDIVMDFVTSDPQAVERTARVLFTILLVTACCGIAVRLFLVASITIDDPETGIQYRRLFPFIFLIDQVWALAPLILTYKWRVGVTLLCFALLAYSPIAQRNLVRSAYPSRRSGSLQT